MKLEAKKCPSCLAPLGNPAECGYCGTIFEFLVDTPKEHPWAQQLTVWMENSKYTSAIHYGPDGTPTLYEAHRIDGPEKVRVFALGNATQESITRLTQLGRILS